MVSEQIRVDNECFFVFFLFRQMFIPKFACTAHLYRGEIIKKKLKIKGEGRHNMIVSKALASVVHGTSRNVSFICLNIKFTHCIISALGRR